MLSLRVVSKKHENIRAILAFVLVLFLLMIPRITRLLAFLVLLGLALVVLLVCWFSGKSARTLYLTYKIESELLRADLYWREAHRDEERGRLYVDLPRVRVVNQGDDRTLVYVANSAKFQDKLLNLDLSPAIDGFALDSTEMNRERSEVVYSFRRLGSSSQLTFETLEELRRFAVSQDGTVPIDKLYSFKERIHTIITGKTGSGKTFALLYLLLFYHFRNYEISLVDPKRSEISRIGKSFGAVVASSANDIIRMVGEVKQELDSRSEAISGLLEPGQTAFDYGFPGKILVIDEFQSLVLRFGQDKKALDALLATLGTIILEGRQLGIFVILAMQQAHSQTISTGIREQLENQAVLGNSGHQTYVTLFGQEAASKIPKVSLGVGECYLVTDKTREPRFASFPHLPLAFQEDLARRLR